MKSIHVRNKNPSMFLYVDGMRQPPGAVRFLHELPLANSDIETAPSGTGRALVRAGSAIGQTTEGPDSDVAQRLSRILRTTIIPPPMFGNHQDDPAYDSLKREIQDYADMATRSSGDVAQKALGGILEILEIYLSVPVAARQSLVEQTREGGWMSMAVDSYMGDIYAALKQVIVSARDDTVAKTAVLAMENAITKMSKESSDYFYFGLYAGFFIGIVPGETYYAFRNTPQFYRRCCWLLHSMHNLLEIPQVMEKLPQFFFGRDRCYDMKEFWARPAVQKEIRGQNLQNEFEFLAGQAKLEEAAQAAAKKSGKTD
jgi:hypothetical protein